MSAENKTPFFKRPLFRFLTQPEVISTISSITADEILAYYQQEWPNGNFSKIYDALAKDLEEILDSNFFNRDITSVLRNIRDAWRSFLFTSITKYQKSVATVVDVETSKWVEEAINNDGEILISNKRHINTEDVLETACPESVKKIKTMKDLSASASSASGYNESHDLNDSEDSETESIDVEQDNKEIRSLTENEVDILKKLLKILVACQEKDREAGKDFLTSVSLNGIIDLSDDETYKQIKKSLNKDQMTWLEEFLRKKTFNQTPEFTQYINQFTEDACIRAEIPTIVRKSFILGRFDPFHYEAHDIAQQILTHLSVRLEAPMRVEYKGLDRERTYAIDTIVYILNRLFRMHQDELDVAWIEQTTPDTKNHKFDGLYKVIRTTNKNQVIIITEFSYARKTPLSKKNGDQLKLCRNSMRTLNKLLQIVPKGCARVYLVQSFNGFIEIKYLVRPLPSIYILQRFMCIKIPVSFGDFEQIAHDLKDLMNWQVDVLSTVRAVNKATTANIMGDNNLHITLVNDTPLKKKDKTNL
ncbi:hypothetical protein G9A89_006792 [Geosiphon pyriformis]|nr:hypothetical protein G9A89_006792 [Geosiphon pyriformis]